MQSNNAKVCKESNDSAIPKSQAHIILEIVEYVPDSIVCRTIIKNKGGKISAVAYDKGEEFCETTAKYDIYVQIIDGKAKVTIGKKDWELKLGQGMIIPVNTVHCFKANSEFKMITTTIRHTGKSKAVAVK